MNNKILLTPEQKKERLKESKRRYYLKNKDKYKKWNAHSGFKCIIENSQNEKELTEYLNCIIDKLKLLNEKK